jgi:hypothetical protein
VPLQAISDFYPEYGGSMFLQNFGNNLPDYMVSQPKLQKLNSSVIKSHKEYPDFHM